MSTEIWILLVLGAATGSALITFFLARRGAPTRKQLSDLEAELESARDDARQVEGRVSEHFERSAVLFGQLAKDYKAFLDHYSDSAQALGLSERRARELLEQGYQPLLTHLEQDVMAEAEESAEASRVASGSTTDAVEADAVKAAGDSRIADKTADAVSSNAASAEKSAVAENPDGERTLERAASQAEPPLMKDVVQASATADAPAAADVPAAAGASTSARAAKVVAVDLEADADARAKVERQAGQG